VRQQETQRRLGQLERAGTSGGKTIIEQITSASAGSAGGSTPAAHALESAIHTNIDAAPAADDTLIFDGSVWQARLPWQIFDSTKVTGLVASAAQIVGYVGGTATADQRLLIHEHGVMVHGDGTVDAATLILNPGWGSSPLTAPTNSGFALMLGGGPHWEGSPSGVWTQSDLRFFYDIDPTFTHSGTLKGLLVGMLTGSAPQGTITNATALEAYTELVASTITNHRYLHLKAPVVNTGGGAAITNIWGIDIDDLDATGVGTARGIRNNSLTRLVGTTTVGLDGDGPQVLSVSGNVGLNNQAGVVFYEGAAFNGNTWTITPPSSWSTDFTLLLPSDVPSAGEVLKVASYSSGTITTEWSSAADITGTKATLLLLAASGKPATTSGCAAGTTVEASTNDVDYDVLDFDASTQEYARWQVFMPDNYDPAVDMKATFVWTTAASSGNVIWGIQALAVPDDGAIDQAWGTAAEVTDGFLAAGDVHISAESSGFAPGGTDGAGRMFFFRVYRKAADGGDTLNGDARLMAVRIEYGITALSA